MKTNKKQDMRNRKILSVRKTKNGCVFVITMDGNQKISISSYDADFLYDELTNIKRKEWEDVAKSLDKK